MLTDKVGGFRDLRLIIIKMLVFSPLIYKYLNILYTISLSLVMLFMQNYDKLMNNK